MTRDEYVKMIKSTALSFGKSAVFAALVVEAPWIKIPPFSWIFDYLIGLILQKALDETEIGAFFLYMDFRMSAQGKDFEQAALKNREVQLHGTEEEKKDAEEKLAIALRNLRFVS